jgi:hypothetical protein
MNEEAKIQLSAREMELVNNTEWIFTKQLIIEKVYLLFGQLHENFKKIIDKEKKYLPEELQKPGGKISKGENYKGLPYVILDYPASFTKEKILAVRTFFWWGNFFSIALHISGDHLRESVFSKEAVEFIQERNFSVCINENEWHHHFHSTNFVAANQMNDAEIRKLSEKNFLKIAKKTELVEWDSAKRFLEDTFKEIIEFVKLSFPAGEKDL